MVVPILCSARGNTSSLAELICSKEGSENAESVCFCAATLGNCTVQRCVEVVAETCHSVLNLADIAAALGSTCRGCQTTVVEQLLNLDSINDIVYAD